MGNIVFFTMVLEFRTQRDEKLLVSKLPGTNFEFVFVTNKSM